MPRSSHSKCRPFDVGKTTTFAPACPKSRRSMSRPRVGLNQRWCSRCMGDGNGLLAIPGGRGCEEIGEQSALAWLFRQLFWMPLNRDEVMAIFSFDAFD